MSGDVGNGGGLPGAVHTCAQLEGRKHQPGEIVPLDGWCVDSGLGLQRFDDTSAGSLVRLDEALHWLMHGREWPRGKAVYAVFSPLVQWDEADGQARRQVLYVLNHQDYAYPLSLGDRLNPRAADVWGDLAFSFSNTYSQGTVREVADLWDASWPGYSHDSQRFYREGWVSYCKTMKGLAQTAVGVVSWEDEYRKRYYMDLGAWKERCKKAVQSLRRLAVPIGVAHELWGYGHVQKPAAAVSALSAAPDVVEVFPLKDFPALVAYRKENAGAVWTLGNQLEIGRAEFARRTATGLGKVVVLDAMHEEMGGKPNTGRVALNKTLFGERKRLAGVGPREVDTGGGATLVRSGKRA